ncbi:MAG: hypothetical protein ACKOZU_10670 [Planctomycetaceae bacterium]
MEHRLGRTVRTFLVVLAAAGFYRLAVVPWVEPRVPDPQADLQLSPEEAAAIRARADRRLAALAEVFPPGSWEREEPIMLESRQMRLLFKEYHTLPDGRVNLVPCTLVVLPDRNRAADAGTGRTLVLRAPRGAVLEFDEPLDLKQGRLAKLVGGSLRGQVTIRGLPSAPGAEDDIEIVTRDIELDELQVQTVEAVQFRYGRSTGSGRGLAAKLTPRQGPPGQGPNIGGVESIRLDRDVRLRLEGLAGGLLPGPGTPPPAADAAAGEPAPPVLVSCRGSLCLNVAADVITLEDKVEVVRTGTQSGTDHLACDLLAILLGRRERPAASVGALAGAGAAEAASAPSAPLEPLEIQAKGAPVVATSAQAGIEARAARLGYEIATRRIVLDGDDPVSLVVKQSEMEARKIDYCPGPPGSPGTLMAVGPGRLASRPEQGRPMRVRWQQWLRMRPDGAGHVVSLAGDAEVVVEGQGRLAGSEMHLWLDVAADGGGRAAPADGPDMSRIRPSRPLARGMVATDAEQVEARTDRLELWFRGQPAAGAAAAQPAAPVAAAAPARPLAPPPVPGRSANRIVASAALLRGLVVMGPAGNQLEEMSMEGQVRLAEQVAAPVAGGPPAESGLEIDGDQMQVSRAAGPDARAIVSGRPARVRGRGLDLSGPLVEFDRGRGRITVDGAGRLALPVDRGAGGLDLMGFTEASPAAAPVAGGPPGSLDVSWQGRLDFDGRIARFIDRVVATSGAASVKSGSLDVLFDRPFDLGGPPRPGARQPEVVKVACGGGVHVESESTAADGGRSRDRLHARDLVVDRVTGDVTGTGPGRLTSTRFGQQQPLAPTAAPGPAVQPVSAPRPASGLSYLGVDFQRGLRGNVHHRRMEFHQRVEAVWGPVAGWDDTLDPHAATGLAPGVVTVSCDVLGVGQVPPAAGRPKPSIEVAAGGNVLVEGESFTARSARLTWAEAKDLLVFEGDGRADAQLFRQLQAGGQPSSASAGKILYWRGLNRVDVEDARYLDLDQIRGGPAPAALPGAPATRGPAATTPRPLPGT